MLAVWRTKLFLCIEFKVLSAYARCRQGCRSGGGRTTDRGHGLPLTASLLGSSEFASPMFMTGACQLKRNLIGVIFNIEVFVIIYGYTKMAIDRQILLIY